MKNTYVFNMKVEAEYAIKADTEEEAYELASEWFSGCPWEVKRRIDNTIKEDAEI